MSVLPLLISLPWTCCPQPDTLTSPFLRHHRTFFRLEKLNKNQPNARLLEADLSPHFKTVCKIFGPPIWTLALPLSVFVCVCARARWFSEVPRSLSRPLRPLRPWSVAGRCSNLSDICFPALRTHLQNRCKRERRMLISMCEYISSFTQALTDGYFFLFTLKQEEKTGCALSGGGESQVHARLVRHLCGKILFWIRLKRARKKYYLKY